MEEAYIQSKQNEQVKNLVKLRERKHRDRQERFLVEGLRELEHAIGSGFEIETIYFCPELFPSAAHQATIDQLRRDGEVPLTRMSEEAFSKAAYREGPDGIVGIGKQQAHSLHELHLPKQPLLLVLEGIEKPGNLGAILRSADGAGADAIILTDCILDLYNPNAIRSSQGLIFALPIVNADREALADWLQKGRYQTVAATPHTDQSHWEIDYTKPTALFFGSESDGLSDYWMNHLDQRICIPMKGRADSLNVAAAAAVCLYEARRQRQVS
ncbi:TrmH family RNA methyltransferase [Coraliomargarita akajimensis]|uniref:tRNA/rRNA methyltransferase (SpoU) n=1 Tax=Coraliomargarita akajimensis (strain DSM 45221 / IAM 15411 / JCM 23193 / KCTC 12865 / 04OKA010-24) TaxID=583355 RepID=D5ENM1_CORAD|nr:RNA methyltransferase [Coraliomargarita akajimensis]ADE55497.1 tRNA/rRNA methyltransferase (SpoU) [Coraliomargarita akajimensis DSM 45221]